MDLHYSSLGSCCISAQSAVHDLYSRWSTRFEASCSTNDQHPMISLFTIPFISEKENYFLTPKVRFLSLIWFPWHFLHLVEEMGFFAPHLKQILKNSLRCCAICFLVASVIGNIFLRYPCVKAWFVPFYLYDRTNEGNSHIQIPSRVEIVSEISIFVKVMSNFSSSNP